MAQTRKHLVMGRTTGIRCQTEVLWIFSYFLIEAHSGAHSAFFKIFSRTFLSVKSELRAKIPATVRMALTVLQKKKRKVPEGAYTQSDKCTETLAYCQDSFHITGKH